MVTNTVPERARITSVRGPVSDGCLITNRHRLPEALRYAEPPESSQTIVIDVLAHQDPNPPTICPASLSRLQADPR